MSTLQETLASYAIDKHLSFKPHVTDLSNDDPTDALWVAHIDNAHGSASICLQGAHLMHWQPKSQTTPVIWLSNAAKIKPGKSIRGGAPVCWPWFGAHATEATFPAHGFARTVAWQVTSSRALDDGSTELAMTLQPDANTLAQWPHASQVSILINVGTTLKMALTTRNLSTTDFCISEALHTYFHISDIAQVAVTGLDGLHYHDKAAGWTQNVQASDVHFAQEVDRVYINTGSTCSILDAGLQRSIHIQTQGSQSTVVWTPWQDKANAMGDMGTGQNGKEGWREMLCVESANALDNTVTVPGGTAHTMAVQYNVAAL